MDMFRIGSFFERTYMSVENKTTYYLAVDIGASSGRHILAHMENQKIVLEEIYRFENHMDTVDGHKIWDMKRLFQEVKNGMKKCFEEGKVPVSMAIDTWAVDYVLLDKDDNMLGPCFAYRDSRTEDVDREVYKIISEKELYKRTGIQKAIFNTIYQLESLKKDHPEWLSEAETLLMVPDYLNFLLTGVRKQEYTNATTTQLVSAETGTWDRELIGKLGLPMKLFGELSDPGEKVGRLRAETVSEIGFDCEVILPATHDTGSAVMSVPTEEEDALYISSGTWSLLGTELKKPDVTDAAAAQNFTNEGGYEHRYRFLKNIMGLWMIQSARKEFLSEYIKEEPESSPIQKTCGTAYGEAESGSEEKTGFKPGTESIGSDSCRKEDRENSLMKENESEDRKYYTAQDFSFSSICQHAAEADIDSLVDANDQRFLAPESMVAEVKNACRETGQKVPETPWEIARVIYRSLARCYKDAVAGLEKIRGKKYTVIHIVGGGSNAEWLNQLTAAETKLTVLAGPSEATAIGNLGAQMIYGGVFRDLKEFRRSVKESFDIKEYRGSND
ncbi:MAG: rhamnulokinase [Lachnospiraceae bacterium]|nr:rhamnulokinase [Lachnospiraceae bacterium]